MITIIDPGVKHEPGYGVFDQAVERDVLCRTEGGDIYIGQVWPGNTVFPDFATQEARDVVGRAQRRARRVGARRHLERHERARDGGHRPAGDALRPGTRQARALPQPVRPADGHGHDEGLLRADAGSADLHPVAGRVRRHPAVRRQLDGRQPVPLGPPVGAACRWRSASGLSGQPFVGADIGGFQATPTPSCSCAGCSTAR